MATCYAVAGHLGDITMRVTQLTGRGWDEPIALAERRLRAQSLARRIDEMEVEFPEAELEESERKAAIARERVRRMQRSQT
jgi:hypothetical protein